MTQIVKQRGILLSFKKEDLSMNSISLCLPLMATSYLNTLTPHANNSKFSLASCLTNSDIKNTR